jgi:hypothetical protein
MIEILPVWQPAPTNATQTPPGGATVSLNSWSLCLPYEAEEQAKWLGTEKPMLQSTIGNALIDYADEARGIFFAHDADLGRYVNQKKALEVAIAKGLYRRPGFEPRPEWSGASRGWTIGWKELPVPPPITGTLVNPPKGARLSSEEQVILQAVKECQDLVRQVLTKLDRAA